MTEKKKGFWSRFKGLFSKPNPDDNIEIKMSDWGLSLESQNDLQARLHVQKLVHKYLSTPITKKEPTEFLDALQKKMDVLDAAIDLTGMPWANPGGNDKMAQRIHAWQGQYADATVLISAIRKYYVEDEKTPNPVEYMNINTEEIVGLLYDVIVVHIFAPGKVVMALCFFDKHTAPRQIAMVQGIIPKGGYPPTTMQYPKQFGNDQDPQPQNWGKPRYTTE